MTAQIEPEIVLYDLASTKARIPYRTIFLELPDIEPTLKALGLVPVSPESKPKYTVPTIHHIPTNTHIMESGLIAQFLESTYPDPPVPLTSELGREIERKSRAVVGMAFSTSVLPREIRILSPRAQEYFRRTREAMLGYQIEDLLANEDQNWEARDDDIRAVGRLMRTHEADGPFVLGARPTYTDFFIAGSLQSAKVVDEGVFQRIFRYHGFKDVYEACLPYMEKKD